MLKLVVSLTAGMAAALLMAGAAPTPVQEELYQLGTYCQGPGSEVRCAQLNAPALPAPIAAARQNCPSGGLRGCQALLAAAETWISENRYKNPRDEAGLRAASFMVFYANDQAAAAAERAGPAMSPTQCMHQDRIFDTIYAQGRTERLPGADAFVTPASNKVRECRLLYTTIAQPTDLPASGPDAVGRTCWMREEIRSCPAGITKDQPALKVGASCTCWGLGGGPGAIRR